ncbi:hypothetical protein Q4555_03905 [Octadecabacter sp. 1_MG-2023]|uniref:hypothetical protein n=1 Tax=unclassified Octadecabacter TaxID=196158 RepID=UPI001C0925C3|nr:MULTISPECIES: hypothetical protein [unclassified Octadecabacter]MBU2992752.1 hypothetical protein [Octadecabacter sp. B2R22]MDO6733797.1 hypothetical protein [Octadecabacter sp. 1_MG-2023]
MDYCATITVPAAPVAASHAIRKEMHLWWSTQVEMKEDGATVRFNNSHVTFAFDPMDPALRMIWPCTKAHMIIEDVPDTEEWEGTSLIWDISAAGTGSEITLTHKGLNSDLQCLDVCSRGWDHFFAGSLCRHLNGEAPTPETST